MADNVAITAGSGTTVAADDIAGVMHQRVKLSLGADGTAVDAVAGAGAVGTGVQRVTLASDDPVTTAVQIMDDWDESDRAKVNIIVGQAGVAAGAGAVGATVQRVTLASDDPLVSNMARPSTGTITSVAGSASDGTILASNSSRKGASVFNDSTAILYLALANTTSSTSVYTVQLAPSAYYEVPGNYTGVLKGIWASATGNARVTEWT